MQIVANGMVLVRVGERGRQRWAHARRCKVRGHKSKREERAGRADREREVLPALAHPALLEAYWQRNRFKPGLPCWFKPNGEKFCSGTNRWLWDTSRGYPIWLHPSPLLETINSPAMIKSIVAGSSLGVKDARPSRDALPSLDRFT